MPLNDSKISVITGYFEQYRSYLVAPNHLLFGLVQNILSYTYAILHRSEEQKLASTAVFEALDTNGLVVQKTEINEKRNSLNSMTLSGVFSVLNAALHAFKRIRTLEDESSLVSKFVSSMGMLKSLVGFTY